MSLSTAPFLGSSSYPLTGSSASYNPNSSQAQYKPVMCNHQYTNITSPCVPKSMLVFFNDYFPNTVLLGADSQVGKEAVEWLDHLGIKHRPEKTYDKSTVPTQVWSQIEEYTVPRKIQEQIIAAEIERRPLLSQKEIDGYNKLRGAAACYLNHRKAILHSIDRYDKAVDKLNRLKTEPNFVGKEDRLKDLELEVKRYSSIFVFEHNGRFGIVRENGSVDLSQKVASEIEEVLKALPDDWELFTLQLWDLRPEDSNPMNHLLFHPGFGMGAKAYAVSHRMYPEIKDLFSKVTEQEASRPFKANDVELRDLSFSLGGKRLPQIAPCGSYAYRKQSASFHDDGTYSAVNAPSTQSTQCLEPVKRVSAESGSLANSCVPKNMLSFFNDYFPNVVVLGGDSPVGQGLVQGLKHLGIEHKSEKTYDQSTVPFEVWSQIDEYTVPLPLRKQIIEAVNEKRPLSSKESDALNRTRGAAACFLITGRAILDTIHQHEETKKKLEELRNLKDFPEKADRMNALEAEVKRTSSIFLFEHNARLGTVEKDGSVNFSQGTANEIEEVLTALPDDWEYFSLLTWDPHPERALPLETPHGNSPVLHRPGFGMGTKAYGLSHRIYPELKKMFSDVTEQRALRGFEAIDVELQKLSFSTGRLRQIAPCGSYAYRMRSPSFHDTNTYSQKHHGATQNSQCLEARKVVSANLMGGLGNQMFQAATACAHALDIGGVCRFRNLPVDHVKESPALHRLIREEINIAKKLDEKDNFYQTMKLPNESVMLDGYFQSSKYFHHRRDEILKMFAPSSEIKSALSTKYKDLLAKDTVAIHVRRGDYMSSKNELGQIYYHLAEDGEYYKKSLEAFDLDKNHFVIFSDDIEFAKKLPAFKNLKNIDYISGQKGHEDFYLMSMCKNHVIANSTFSWWAAYLSQNPAQKVIMPKRWFGGGFAKEPGFNPTYVKPCEDIKNNCYKTPEGLALSSWTQV